MEREKIINPYQIERNHVAGVLDFNLNTSRNRVLVNRRFILGAAKSDDNTLFLLTADESVAFSTEKEFAEFGPRSSRSAIPGRVNTADIKLPGPEKIFIGNGEFEVKYLGRNHTYARFFIFSTHDFSYNWIWIETDANSYLKKVLASPNWIHFFTPSGTSRPVNRLTL